MQFLIYIYWDFVLPGRLVLKWEPPVKVIAEDVYKEKHSTNVSTLFLQTLACDGQKVPFMTTILSAYNLKKGVCDKRGMAPSWTLPGSLWSGGWWPVNPSASSPWQESAVGAVADGCREGTLRQLPRSRCPCQWGNLAAIEVVHQGPATALCVSVTTSPGRSRRYRWLANGERRPRWPYQPGRHTNLSRCYREGDQDQQDKSRVLKPDTATTLSPVTLKKSNSGLASPSEFLTTNMAGSGVPSHKTGSLTHFLPALRMALPAPLRRFVIVLSNINCFTQNCQSRRWMTYSAFFETVEFRFVGVELPCTHKGGLRGGNNVERLRWNRKQDTWSGIMSHTKHNKGNWGWQDQLHTTPNEDLS